MKERREGAIQIFDERACRVGTVSPEVDIPEGLDQVEARGVFDVVRGIRAVGLHRLVMQTHQHDRAQHGEQQHGEQQMGSCLAQLGHFIEVGWMRRS